MKFATHYDNLGVAKNAQPEVIKAAYKALAQKYHPDRNLDNPDAQRIMTIINEAYQVLSDPVSRAKHDRWIAQQQAKQTGSDTQTTSQQSKQEQAQARQSSQTQQGYAKDSHKHSKHAYTKDGVHIHVPNVPSRSFGRSDNRLLAGVIGGLSDYLNISPIIPRIVFFLAAMAFVPLIFLYILLWFFMPEKHRSY